MTLEQSPPDRRHSEDHTAASDETKTVWASTAAQRARVAAADVVTCPPQRTSGWTSGSSGTPGGVGGSDLERFRCRGGEVSVGAEDLASGVERVPAGDGRAERALHRGRVRLVR